MITATGEGTAHNDNRAGAGGLGHGAAIGRHACLSGRRPSETTRKAEPCAISCAQTNPFWRDRNGPDRRSPSRSAALAGQAHDPPITWHDGPPPSGDIRSTNRLPTMRSRRSTSAVQAHRDRSTRRALAQTLKALHAPSADAAGRPDPADHECRALRIGPADQAADCPILRGIDGQPRTGISAPNGGSASLRRRRHCVAGER